MSSIDRAERAGASSAEQLLPLVYTELRKLAAAKMAREAPGLTLQPTALVHEAWLRLGGDEQPSWQNRAHFFAAAAEAMRRILIDQARKRRTPRHGGDLVRLNFDDVNLAAVAGDDQLLAIDEALEKLARRDPPKAELVKLRYFAGLNHAEAARTLGISEVTAKRWWAYARAWLYEELGRNRAKS
jgi:RNA polymerase sigma factor (TIGR02999 family)